VETTANLPYVDTRTLDGPFPLLLAELKFVQLAHSEGWRERRTSRLPGIRHRHYACSSQPDWRRMTIALNASGSSFQLGGPDVV
jgi:hypothetical protein